MTVLVAYGSTNGSTREIAAWIGDELRANGLAAEVRPAAEVTDLAGYEAVVLGGAVYAAGWHHDARAFAHRFAGAATAPVWLFSSGPLDDSAETGDIPPVPQVEAALAALHARKHVTFGGRASDEAHGWLGREAHRLAARGHGADFRNPGRIRSWTRAIAAELVTPTRPPSAGAATG